MCPLQIQIFLRLNITLFLVSLWWVGGRHVDSVCLGGGGALPPLSLKTFYKGMPRSKKKEMSNWRGWTWLFPGMLAAEGFAPGCFRHHYSHHRKDIMYFMVMLQQWPAPYPCLPNSKVLWGTTQEAFLVVGQILSQAWFKSHTNGITVKKKIYKIETAQKNQERQSQSQNKVTKNGSKGTQSAQRSPKQNGRRCVSEAQWLGDSAKLSKELQTNSTTSLVSPNRQNPESTGWSRNS